METTKKLHLGILFLSTCQTIVQGIQLVLLRYKKLLVICLVSYYLPFLIFFLSLFLSVDLIVNNSSWGQRILQNTTTILLDNFNIIIIDEYTGVDW